MARDRAHTGECYRECDLCGFLYRKSELVRNTAGLYVCTHHDADVGEYAFAPPVPSSDPVLYDEVDDKYYNLDNSNTHLAAVEMVSLGGFRPPPYIVADWTAHKSYQLLMSNGQLCIKEGVEGKPHPLIADNIDGVEHQLRVQVNASGVPSLYFMET